jgi:hypothetical protein
MSRATTALLFALPLAASAADLGVPLSWRVSRDSTFDTAEQKFSNSRPVAERQSIAQAVSQLFHFTDAVESDPLWHM